MATIAMPAIDNQNILFIRLYLASNLRWNFDKPPLQKIGVNFVPLP